MTTTENTKPRALPWGKWGAEIDRQVAAHTTPESIEAAIQAHLAGQTTVRNGAPTYRDPGTRESYTVGYGGERHYSRPAAPARDYTPSDAQIRFLNGLLAEREHSYTEAQIAEGRADWRKIRPMLDELKVSARRDPRARQASVETSAAPASERARLDFSAIPDGNYAVRDQDGVVKFYRVSTKGQWKNVQVRASDELWPLKGRAGIAVLHQIVEAGLAESRMLFVTELERCCRCGRSLTDEESRANARVNGGYGPDCEGK